MDHAARYQLLDHATDESPLWEARRRITTHGVDDVAYLRHRDRPPRDLRPELERLLRDGHVGLYRLSDRERALTLDESIAVIADETNWDWPGDLQEPDSYALFLTESGQEEFRREYELANEV